jgi:conjugative transfer region protein TrbK
MTRSRIGKGLMLAGAAMILTLIIVGATGDMGRDDHVAITPPPAATAAHPQQAALERCQSLGEAASKDAACLALWAETRRRFLTPSPPPSEGE